VAYVSSFLIVLFVSFLVVPSINFCMGELSSTLFVCIYLVLVITYLYGSYIDQYFTLFIAVAFSVSVTRFFGVVCVTVFAG
jgi:hypothetical protein